MTLPGHLGFPRPSAVVEVFPALAPPYPPDPCWREEHPACGEFLGGAPLSPGRLLQGNPTHGLLHLRGTPGLAIRFAPPQLRPGRFPACVLPLCKALATVPPVAPHFPGWGHLAPLLGYLQQPYLHLAPFLRRLHLVAAFCPPGRFGQRRPYSTVRSNCSFHKLARSASNSGVERSRSLGKARSIPALQLLSTHTN